MADGSLAPRRPTARQRALESAYAPEALNRSEAARYVGVSATTFDVLVREGEMPLPRRYRHAGRIVWLRRELDSALDDLPVDGGRSPSPQDPIDL